MKREVRKIGPHEALDRLVEQNVELFEHLRGPGHGLSDEAAVRAALQSLADMAKRMIP